MSQIRCHFLTTTVLSKGASNVVLIKRLTANWGRNVIWVEAPPRSRVPIVSSPWPCSWPVNESKGWVPKPSRHFLSAGSLLLLLYTKGILWWFTAPWAQRLQANVNSEGLLLQLRPWKQTIKLAYPPTLFFLKKVFVSILIMGIYTWVWLSRG